MNSRWRKINEFLVVSNTGKKQTGLGAFLADADLNVRENCQVEIDLEIERGTERSCDNRDLTGEPVKSRYAKFRLTYENPTPLQMFRMVAYKEGAVTAPTGAPANEVQTLTRSGSVVGGTFTIGITLEGRSGLTKPIAFDASPALVLAAIIDQSKTLGKIIKPGDIAVTGDWTAGIVLTFARRLGKADLPLIVVGNTNITGGGSISVAQTTPGGQNFHTAQRSADGSKPLFSLATGDQNGSIATQKFGDAVVDSIDFAVDTGKVNVSMTVVICCNFIPDLVSNFAVAPCVKLPAVRVQDVRVKINGNFENRDLVSHAVSLNDNVPKAAAFVFDDIDVSIPFVSGDQPVQSFTTEIFGDAGHPLYALANNEYVTGNEVEFITHFGNPGSRVSVIGGETKIKPQGQLAGFSGEANQSTVKFTGTPYSITGLPVRYEASLDQSTAFLSV